MNNPNYPDFIKYPSILHLAEDLSILDNDVKLFEKLDGGNSQVRYYNGRILAGNRSKFLSEINKRFGWFQSFLKWAKSNYSFFNLPEEVIVYGEWLNSHTLEYSKESKNHFYLIDLFDIASKKFLDYSNAVEKIKIWGIEDVRVLDCLFNGKISEKKLEDLVINRESDYRKGHMEGVVVKDYSSQSFSKLWRKSLVQKEITFEDLKKQIFTLGEEGKKISRKSILGSIIDDLERQNIPYDRQNVKEIVEGFLKNKDLDKI
ncbi:MAG: RNA ligase family protein [archaeon]